MSACYGGTIKVWAMRPVDESEWEEMDISNMEKDDDGEVKIEGLGYISENYWKNKVTGDLERLKPSGSETLRLEPGMIKVMGRR